MSTLPIQLVETVNEARRGGGLLAALGAPSQDKGAGGIVPPAGYAILTGKQPDGSTITLTGKSQDGTTSPLTGKTSP